MESIKTLAILPPRLKIVPADTLFEPDWWLGKQGICPLCLNKLFPMKNKPFLYCKSNKHKKPFIINKSKIDEKVKRTELR